MCEILFVFLLLKLSLKVLLRDFPGGPVVKTSPFNATGAGSIPSRGPKISPYLEAKKPKHETEAIL